MYIYSYNAPSSSGLSAYGYPSCKLLVVPTLFVPDGASCATGLDHSSDQVNKGCRQVNEGLQAHVLAVLAHMQFHEAHVYVAKATARTDTR